MKKLRTIKSLGWSGLWNEDEPTLGWLLSKFAHHKYSERLNEDQLEILSGKSGTFAASDFYRVEITIKPVKDKRGNYIVRRAKTNEA